MLLPANIKKEIFIFIAALFLAFNLAGFAAAGKSTKPEPSSYIDYSVFSERKYSQIENNLLAGLRSYNIGLRTSCAYFLGEMGSGKSIIPLLKLLRNGETEESRIHAALALYKIGSKVGIYRIKELAKNDKSETVRKVLERLYKTYVTKKPF
jgi:HEAT repeat protein